VSILVTLAKPVVANTDCASRYIHKKTALKYAKNPANSTESFAKWMFLKFMSTTS